MSDREPWDIYFLRMAFHAATRATCRRARMGCVLTRGNAVLTTGYNGSAPGLPHCLDEGCDMEAGHCVRCNHAEQNAVYLGARNGVSLEGATAYVTATPCWMCFRALVIVGARRVVYADDYRPDARVTEAARALGVELVQLRLPDWSAQEGAL